MSTLLLLLASVFFPVIAVIASVYFFITGQVGLAAIFFIWWLLWD